METKAWPWLHTTLSVPCSIDVNSECCTVKILGEDSLEKAALASFFQHMYIYKYLYISIYLVMPPSCVYCPGEVPVTLWMFSVDFQSCVGPAFGQRCTDGNSGDQLFMNKESFTEP